MSSKFFYHLFKNHFSVSDQTAIHLNLVVNLIVLAFLGYIFFKVFRYFGSKFVKKIAAKTKTNFDDLLIKNRVFLNISRIIVFVILYTLLSPILIDFPNLLKQGERIIDVAIVFFSYMVY